MRNSNTVRATPSNTVITKSYATSYVQNRWVTYLPFQAMLMTFCQMRTSGMLVQTQERTTVVTTRRTMPTKVFKAISVLT